MSSGDGLGAATRDPHRPAGPPEVPPTLSLSVLFHPDPARIGDRTRLPLEGSVELSRLSPELEPARGGPGRPLEDPFISRSGVRLEWSGDRLELAQGARRTALVIDGERVESRASFDADALTQGLRLELAERVILWIQRGAEAHEADGDLGLIGASVAMARVRHLIRTYAPLSAPLLLRGSTGTGKELVARALHQAGPQRAGPFVAANVATLSPGVASSELFGHKKGAFTGAERDRVGLFQQAEGGTLFLDEIGEASLELQAQLLRVLETSTIVPVGGEAERRVAVRVIAATDADLSAMIAGSSFRAALLHRLEACEIELPPLAARREDIGLLLAHLLGQEAKALGVEPPRQRGDDPFIPFELARRIFAHSWPGNVRELRNVARRIVVGAGEGIRALEGLRIEPPREAPSGRPARRRAGEIGDEELLQALESADWKLERAASALGLSRTSLYRRLESHPTLKKSKDLSEEEIARAMDQAEGDVERAAKALRVSTAGLRLRLGAQRGSGKRR